MTELTGARSGGTVTESLDGATLELVPAGLEDWFRAIGKPRQAGDPMPAPFDRPANVETIQAQQRFIRPDKD